MTGSFRIGGSAMQTLVFSTTPIAGTSDHSIWLNINSFSEDGNPGELTVGTHAFTTDGTYLLELAL